MGEMEGMSGAARAIKLDKAEQELHELLQRSDTKEWPRVYALLAKVADEELWRSEFKSYSAWLRDLAKREGVTESLLWQRKKAGDAYNAWAKANPGAPNLEASGISAANLAEVDRLSGGDPAKADTWVRGLLGGTLTQRDIKAARNLQRSQGVAQPKNAYDKAKSAPVADVSPEDAATAADILAALQAESRTWIWGIETDEQRSAREREMAGIRYLNRANAVAQVLAEFPVRVETAQRTRRIDALAVDVTSALMVENDTEDDWTRVCLRGVEIKVSESDLRRDRKMGDYELFCDFFYLAVPESLVLVAEEVADPGAGILVWRAEADERGNHVDVVREPERLDAPRRELALETALVKLLAKQV